MDLEEDEVSSPEAEPSTGTTGGKKRPPSGGGRGGSGGGDGGDTLGSQMSFLDHLEELRQRLYYAVASILIAFAVAFYFHEHIYEFFAEPITGALKDLGLGEKLIYTNPMQPFNVYLKVSFVGAIFLASPLIFWQLWLFISPGLYRNEKKYVLPFVTLTSTLFVSGSYFAYKLAFPPVFRFLFTFGEQFQPMIHIDEYFGLATTLLLGMGLVFEIPVLVLILSIFGIVTPKLLLKNIRYAMLIIAVITAALAPTPDVTTLLLFFFPMVGLYFLSIGLSWLVHKKKKSSAEVE